ncbi:peroxiredoxin [Marinifilum sp. D714]|uniref:peroxiredoxin family protein n=1 Tax=Marinifilum sp. D714 TaxID=2937523 RepID=UPI0027CDA3ED|nr:TlpA disulfide reductase family protein [Marinifilum sp. D714]MDQ2177296.1 TlpA family protein disulfide reductase [Marinifilum sp. D714]
MTIHPRSEFRKNIVKGGKINQEYAKYLDLQHRDYTAGQLIRDSISLLHKNDLYHTQVVKDLLIKEKLLTSKGEKIEIWNQVRKLEESGEGLTQLAKKLELKKDSLNKFLINEELNIIENEINIINYTSLISDVKNSKPWPELFDIERLKSIQKKYASKFKDHPYTKYSNELLWGINEIKKGGDFFDFTLPDMNGKLHTLSKEADGKFALIDIWAPLCGPCIYKSREIKSVYEEFKNNDFTVVAVASKYRNISNVKRILECDKYPWTTLIDKPELDSRINEHYGIKNSGGITILIDKTGKIALVNPSANDVREYLKVNL